jgi:hypothetical protein
MIYMFYVHIFRREKIRVETARLREISGVKKTTMDRLVVQMDKIADKLKGTGLRLVVNELLRIFFTVYSNIYSFKGSLGRHFEHQIVPKRVPGRWWI